MKKTMLDFILETREVGITNLNERKELVSKLVEIYDEGQYQDICIIASGSSGNAAQCARIFMKELLKCEVKIVSPFTFEHYESDIKDATFALVISQSGYSTNAIEALRKIKEMGRLAVGITGDIHSDLKDYCDVLVDYKVGIETVGYVTKGVVTLCEFLMLFALETALYQGKIKDEKYNYYVVEMENAFICHKEMQDAVCHFYEQNKKALLSIQHVYICSSGPGEGVAMEGALKMGETVQIPSIAYEVEEYIHGPNLQLTPNYNVFFIDNHDETSERIRQIYEATSAVTDHTFIISNHYEDSHCISTVHQTCPMVAPLYQLVVFQYLSYKITETLNKWSKHPLFKDFEKIVDSKSSNYKNSPLASEE